MGDVYGVLDCWDSAVAAQEKGDYELAARYYRLCDIYYQNGELPIYYKEVEQKGLEAHDLYWKMVRKLPEEEQRKIKREYGLAFGKTSTSQLFVRNWRDFVASQWDIIIARVTGASQEEGKEQVER